MHSNTTGSDRVAGPYALLAYDRTKERVVERFFSSLPDLADAVRAMLAPAPTWYGDPCDQGLKRYRNVRVYSPRGRALDIEALLSYGLRRHATRPHRWNKPVPGYVRRAGPVQGIRKWRGGRGCSSFAHMNERRLAAGVLREEGEVPPRAARNAHTLPDPWDDERWREAQRSWKTQRKGRKAWDR